MMCSSYFDRAGRAIPPFTPHYWGATSPKASCYAGIKLKQDLILITEEVMYQVMMQQITNDRLKNARQQAAAHRQSLQARVALEAETVNPLDKETLRQDPGIASRL